MKRIAAIIFALILLLPALTSCAKKKTAECISVLLAMTEAEIDLPAGRIYSSKAEEGSDEFLPDSLTSALLGGGCMPELRESWQDMAFYLSLNDSPCEFVVIYCRDNDTAIDTAKLLNARLDAVRTDKKGEKYSKMLDSATVAIVGNYALLIVSSDTENALKTAKKAI
jgi:hypothetical protein